MTQTYFHETTITRGLEEYEVLVEYGVGYWGYVGSYWQPPEPPEYELLSVTVPAPAWAQGRYPADAIPFALTEAEDEAIYNAICMDPPESEGPDPDDERDRRIDDEMSDRARESYVDPFD